MSLYEYYHTIDQARGERFAKAMAGHYDGPIDKPLEDIFPFEQLKEGALIVDIGGGNGQNSLRLASKHPHLSFIIQDHASVTSTASSQIEPSLKTRVTWQAHDFYALQPVKGADIYLLSHILMDHSDTYVLLLSRSQTYPNAVKRVPHYLSCSS